jgi:hypothetical protein
LAGSAGALLGASSPAGLSAGALLGLSPLLAASLGADGLSCCGFFWAPALLLLAVLGLALAGALPCCLGAAPAAGTAAGLSDGAASSALPDVAPPAGSAFLTIADQPVLSGGGCGALSAACGAGARGVGNVPRAAIVGFAGAGGHLLRGGRAGLGRRLLVRGRGLGLGRRLRHLLFCALHGVAGLSGQRPPGVRAAM